MREREREIGTKRLLFVRFIPSSFLSRGRERDRTMARCKIAKRVERERERVVKQRGSCCGRGEINPR